jgi:uncharacterized protein (DUF2147 family)
LRFNLKTGTPAFIFFVSFVLALADLALAGLALADPSGLWREKDGGTIRVHGCGAGYCARIASVKPALDPATGKPRTDANNSDPRKRRRPLVGTPVLMSMTPSGPGKWSGRLYDHDRGQTFVGHLVEVNASTIRIEGCAMGLCGGEELSRVSP